MTKTRVVYATSSQFKRRENEIFVRNAKLDGLDVADLFDFQVRDVAVKEILEIDLQTMVQAEATAVYSMLKVPCVVEHAGLIFVDKSAASYPGGLTKPMWNSLGADFVKETNASGREAIARAVVAYCDGSQVRTFVGETLGFLASTPRGNHRFYWDTVFIPNDCKKANLTYAEIVDDPDLGLEYKVIELSQSTKAMLEFLRYLRANPAGALWE